MISFVRSEMQKLIRGEVGNTIPLFERSGDFKLYPTLPRSADEYQSISSPPRRVAIANFNMIVRTGAHPLVATLRLCKHDMTKYRWFPMSLQDPIDLDGALE